MSTVAQVQPLLRIEGLSKVYPKPESGGSFTVLEDINFVVMPGEIVALLGRSGSGKSTLLRNIAGLSKPTKGVIYSNGVSVRGPNADVSMVFQSFALLPWLNVQENVEIGLESKKLPTTEVHHRANEALRLVGLEGFEKAYPRELSGGMQQRVGFARAFVIQPRVLMLDEPFSALDVLTAENLRGEIADLWEAGNFPAQSVVLVTHNIEEAIMLADRVVVMSSNPGRIRGELRIPLGRPRERNSSAFRAMADHIYTIMTNPDTKITPVAQESQSVIDTTTLPHARPGAISGLLELVEEYGGPEDVAVISDRLRIEADDLLPILDAAVLLRLASIKDGDVTLTERGKQFVDGEVEESRAVFRDQVLQFAPMVRTIHEVVMAAKGKPIHEDFFLDILDEHYSDEEARNQFETALNWGRYAGLMDYDSDEKTLQVPDDGD